jgi:hypothetical protein
MMSSFSELVVIEDFEDGQKPGGTSSKQRLAINKGKQSEGFFSVFDELLPDLWCERAYEYALKRNGKPFGVYILTSEALDSGLDAEGLWQQGQEQKALSLVATRALVFERGRSTLEQDIERIHGTAVWCLSSGVTNSVQYHIDYAELYRYETNITHPPLYAGTCHVSPLEAGEMVGGSFMANMRGLEHYKRFGYKGRLAVSETKDDRTALEEDMESDPAWQSVRYRRNRGIFHDGDLPHLSTPIRSIAEGKRRVIFGFNCFSADVGESCIRAPEHSDAFNRTVKLYQAMAAPKASAEGAEGKVRAKDVLRNPALAKLLVMAAKKVKDHKEQTGEDFLSTMPKNLA